MKHDKVIYIAGAYRSSQGEWHIRDNIRKAEDAALLVWQFGGVALCPHKNTAFFGGAPGTNNKMWLKGDLELLRRCDGLYAVEGWRNSSGAIAEVEFARENGIPVFFNTQELMDFIRHSLPN